MILAGRAYTDIVCLDPIKLDQKLSEYTSEIVQRYGGVIHVLKILKSYDKLILVGDGATLEHVKRNTVAKVSHANTHNIKCTILNLEGRVSRVSIIDNSTVEKIIIKDCIETPKKVVLLNYYLESIPIDMEEFIFQSKLDTKKILPVSIFNGGAGLIKKELLEKNYLMSKIVITSIEGYRLLKKIKLNKSSAIMIIHSPEKYIIKTNTKTIELLNKNYLSNSYKGKIGAGDLFSVLVCRMLEQGIQSSELSLSLIIQSVESASGAVMEFLNEL